MSTGQRLRKPHVEASDLPGEPARSPAVEIFLWSRAAIWAAAVFAFLVFEANRALAVVGGRLRARTAILSISSLLLGVAVVQWALWQWVA